MAQVASTAERNKESAVQFLAMLAAQRVREAYVKFVAPDFVHHNAYFPGGREDLLRAMEEAHRENPDTRIDAKRVIGDGDLVAVHSHVRHKEGERGYAVVHIFRFNPDGKVVELWDVGMEVPAETPNRNGLF